MFKFIQDVRKVAALGNIDINRALLNGAKLVGQFVLTILAVWAFVIALFCMGCSEAHAADRASQSSCVVKSLAASNTPEQKCFTAAASQKSCDSCIRLHWTTCVRAATSCSLNPSETREICGYYAPVETCRAYGERWE